MERGHQLLQLAHGGVHTVLIAGVTRSYQFLFERVGGSSTAWARPA